MARRGFEVRFRVRPNSIRKANRDIRTLTKMVDRLGRNYLLSRFQEIRTITKDGTMVATGQTRSKVFMKHDPMVSTNRYISGYMPTDNNQSLKTEFEDGPVHTTLDEHLDMGGYPKCSRNPTDLFKTLGRYQINPNAKRGALASAIQQVLGVPAGDPVNKGASISYEPDLSNVANDISVLARGFLRSVV